MLAAMRTREQKGKRMWCALGEAEPADGPKIARGVDNNRRLPVTWMQLCL